MPPLESIHLYQMFLELTDNTDKAEKFVDKIAKVIEQKLVEKEKGLATKEDILMLKTAISESKTSISESKVELIKWFVGIGIATVSLVVLIAICIMKS